MQWLISAIELFAFTLTLAGKDADSYLLKDNSQQYQGLTKSRLDRWHRDGVLLNIYAVLLTSWASHLWISASILAILIRLGFYDLSFNKWTSLPLTYIGDTSAIDRVFLSIFGKNGAIKKSVVFLIILILWGISRIWWSTL
jgi:hypothetical protein